MLGFPILLSPPISSFDLVEAFHDKFQEGSAFGRRVYNGDQFIDKRNGCKQEGAITCDVAHARLTWSEETLKAIQSDLQMMVFSRWWLNSRNPLVLPYPSTQVDTTDTSLLTTNSAVKYAYKEHCLCSSTSTSLSSMSSSYFDSLPVL